MLTGLIGIGVFVLAAWVLSSDPRRVPWRLVFTGIALQFVLVVLLLKVPLVNHGFEWVATVVTGIIAQADAGIVFVFGPALADPTGPAGWVFAIRALPVVIYFSSLMAILYYLGIMDRVIAALAWILRRTLRVTGAEALAMAANVFVGQTEAPLTVKPLIEKMTRAQLMTLMVGGFATIAGSVLAAYVSMLAGADEDRAITLTMHLIAASIASAPAAFVMARILVPETETPPPEHASDIRVDRKADHTNVLDAAASGAIVGLKLALNIGAMLIAFVGLIALANWGLDALTLPLHRMELMSADQSLSIEGILGWIFAPLAWTMGVPWDEAGIVGSLMGQKITVTEFIAYQNLAPHMTGDGGAVLLSERSQTICAFALCGFANLPSIAIQIGGLSALAPGRRQDFARLAFKAMIGGAFASWMTACIAGIFV